MNKKFLSVLTLSTSIYIFLTIIFGFFGFFGKNYYISDMANAKNKDDFGKEITLKRENGNIDLPIEKYLFGVVASEMPASFEIEALKAQAVAARTYTYSKIDKNVPEHNGADVCDNINHCKAYMSDEELKEKYGEKWMEEFYPKIKSAVSETKDIIATYDSEPITAVFHSTSSGNTENSKDVWKNDVPYLVSVKSEGESESPKYESEVTFSLEEFKEKINTSGENLNFPDNPNSWIGEITKNETGSVNTIQIGGVNFKGTKVRELLGLNSANFEMDISEKVKISVLGNGHGVGMSQYGANYMAKQGYTYEQILKKYYTGISIEKV